MKQVLGRLSVRGGQLLARHEAPAGLQPPLRARGSVAGEAWVRSSQAAHPFLAKVTSEELLAELAGQEAFGRAAEPWEVASASVFLASDYASYLTGEVISVSSQHP